MHKFVAIDVGSSQLFIAQALIQMGEENEQLFDEAAMYLIAEGLDDQTTKQHACCRAESAIGTATTASTRKYDNRKVMKPIIALLHYHKILVLLLFVVNFKIQMRKIWEEYI